MQLETVEQLTKRKLLHRWVELFSAADEDNDGFLNLNEFKYFMASNSRHFPQLLEFGKQTEELFEKTDLNKDGKLSCEEFQELLNKVDLSMTSFPSSAQTAYQQGKYLGQALNNILRPAEVKRLFKELDEDGSGHLDSNEIKKGLKKLGLPNSDKAVTEFIQQFSDDADGRLTETKFTRFILSQQFQSASKDWKKLSHSKIIPFRYKHLGGYEYVGYDYTITGRGSQGKNILDGFGAWWLWRSIYINRMLSDRNRVHSATDWFGSLIYGRDFTRY